MCFVGESPQWTIWRDGLQLTYSISCSSNNSINTCFFVAHPHMGCHGFTSSDLGLFLLTSSILGGAFLICPCTISKVGTKDAGTRSVYISCPSFYQQWHNSDAAPAHGSIACINRGLCRKCGEFLFLWCHSARIWLYLFETCWVCVSWFSYSIQCIRSAGLGDSKITALDSCFGREPSNVLEGTMKYL